MSTTPTQSAHLDFSAFDRRQAVDIANCRLYTGHDCASAPSLLFVAGGYHGAWCYSHYLDYFDAAGIGCYAVDLPGQGSLAHTLSSRHGIADLAAGLIACCRALARPLIIVGHSVGALPALLAAMEIGPAGVVLLAPSPPGNLPGARPLAPVPVDAAKTPPAADEISHRFLGSLTDGIASLQERLTPESPSVLNDRYQLRIRIDPARINCPGLCIEAGLDDHERHPQGQDQAIARFLGFEYRLLTGQPHCMMYGPQWKESAQLLHAWFRNIYPAREHIVTTTEGICPVMPDIY